MVGVFRQRGFAGVDVRRQEPFRQLVALLEPLPLGRRQRALHEQLFEGAFRRFPIPPAFALPRRLLEIPGEQRAFGANAIQHPSAHLALGAMVPQLAARLRPHHRHREAVVAHGQVGRRMAPVLERLPRREQAVHGGFVVPRNAGEERVVMRPRHHGDGVDLHIAQALQRLAHPGEAGADAPCASQPLVAQRDAAQLGGAGRVVPTHTGNLHTSCPSRPAQCPSTHRCGERPGNSAGRGHWRDNAAPHGRRPAR